jgi:hypothetical protein
MIPETHGLFPHPVGGVAQAPIKDGKAYPFSVATRQLSPDSLGREIAARLQDLGKT